MSTQDNGRGRTTVPMTFSFYPEDIDQFERIKDSIGERENASAQRKIMFLAETFIRTTTEQMKLHRLLDKLARQTDMIGKIIEGEALAKESFDRVLMLLEAMQVEEV